MNYLHAMVRISDIDASLDFFCGGLGMVELSRYDSEQGRYTNIFLCAGGDRERGSQEKSPLLEMTYNWDVEDYGSARNFGHLAFAVDNIYETCERLMERGIEINRPPRDGYMAFVKSPDNISIELLQRGKALPIAEIWVNMPNIGSW